MKKMFIPAIALAAASVAVPAAAQSFSFSISSAPAYTQAYRGQNNGAWQSISQRKYNLDRRIDRGLANRALSRREATRLKAELNSLVRLEYSYQRGGLTRWERTDLDRRYDRLAAQVRYERRDNDNRRG